MLDPSNFKPFQVRAINHQLMHPRSALWLFMGAGKTPITLTTIVHLQEHKAIRAALVVAPLRVVQSGWESEARKWRHLQHLRFSIIHGKPEERLRALVKPADVYLINYEGLVWLGTQLRHYFVDRGTLLPFDMFVMDESPKLKNPEAKRSIAIYGNPDPADYSASLLPYFPYRTALTGTPASNGLEDLFGQFLMLDDGARLGSNVWQFRNNLFEQADDNGYKYKPTPEGEVYIQNAVSDITLQLNEEDYITLPDFIRNDIYVDLPATKRKQYDQLELQLFTELDGGVPLEVNGEAAKANKLLQFANGAAYTNTETKEWEPIHNEKLDALEDILEEAGGSPVLVGYNFKPDAKQIMKRFPFARTLSGLSGKEFNDTLADWDSGNIRLLIGHPDSIGHGVDGLQSVGHILVWFGLNWRLDLTLQLNKRLHRQGQGHPVVCHRILARDTFDDVVRMSLETKTQTQDTLRAAVAEYRNKRGL